MNEFIKNENIREIIKDVTRTANKEHKGVEETTRRIAERTYRSGYRCALLDIQRVAESLLEQQNDT